MQPIPDSVLMRFNALMEKKSVPSSVHEDYRRWLLYYLDFRVKYSLPDDRSGQVRLFIEKMRSKGQSGKSLNHAAHALSLFFSLQPKKTNAPGCSETRMEEPSLLATASAVAGVRPSPSRALAEVPAKNAVLSEARLPAARPGRKYNEWWSMKRTISTEWDTVITDKLAGEITTRHYSRRTLKAYADWSRKFQLYVKHKPPTELSAADVKAYLTYLSVTCKVSASTQNQAFNALLFLFRHILKTDFGDHQDVPRAKRSSYIPVVLTRREIDAILENLSRPHDLVVRLLYGCGLRLFECLKLRVQNFNFDEGLVTIQIR